VPDSIWVETEENPNCEWMPLQVYESHESSKPIRLVTLEDPNYPRGIYGVSGWSSVGGGTPCPALFAPVSDSGQAVVYLVYGGDWGIRLRPEIYTGNWSIKNTYEHGEPYLMLIDRSDIIG
jgi:hypothetical protein